MIGVLGRWSWSKELVGEINSSFVGGEFKRKVQLGGEMSGMGIEEECGIKMVV